MRTAWRWITPEKSFKALKVFFEQTVGLSVIWDIRSIMLRHGISNAGIWLFTMKSFQMMLRKRFLHYLITGHFCNKTTDQQRMPIIKRHWFKHYSSLHHLTDCSFVLTDADIPCCILPLTIFNIGKSSPEIPIIAYTMNQRTYYGLVTYIVCFLVYYDNFQC